MVSKPRLFTSSCVDLAQERKKEEDDGFSIRTVMAQTLTLTLEQRSERGRHLPGLLPQAPPPRSGTEPRCRFDGARGKDTLPPCAVSGWKRHHRSAARRCRARLRPHACSGEGCRSGATSHLSLTAMATAACASVRPMARRKEKGGERKTRSRV